MNTTAMPSPADRWAIAMPVASGTMLPWMPLV